MPLKSLQIPAYNFPAMGIHPNQQASRWRIGL